jgi:DNA mismatch repair ATPase MutS
MDYRVVAAHGGTNESDALALARLLGLEPSIVERARSLHDGT